MHAQIDEISEKTQEKISKYYVDGSLITGNG